MFAATSAGLEKLYDGNKISSQLVCLLQIEIQDEWNVNRWASEVKCVARRQGKESKHSLAKRLRPGCVAN
jgi:hypothetical protein